MSGHTTQTDHDGNGSGGASLTRDDLTATVHAELAFMARRFRARAADIRPGLSLTAFTLLAYLNETGGSRAAELVEYHSLNKSTVSRQLTELAAGGLVDRELDARDSRVQIVRISAAGRAVLARFGEMFQPRPQTDAWPDEDLKTFARLLRRYNGRQELDAVRPITTALPCPTIHPHPGACSWI